MNEKAYRWVVVLCNIAGGASTGLGAMYGFSSRFGPALLTVGVVLLAVPAVTALATTVKRSGLDIRDSAIVSLTELCHVLLDLPSECDARVTIHRVDESHDPPILCAIARGGRDGKVPKSRMTIHQGVAGLCYRSEKVAHKPDIVDFNEDMRQLGFTDEDIRQFQSDRKAYLCLPVQANGSVVAVVSCDSNKAGVFGQQQEKVVEKLTPFFGRLLTIEERVKE